MMLYGVMLYDRDAATLALAGGSQTYSAMGSLLARVVINGGAAMLPRLTVSAFVVSKRLGG